MKVVFLIGNKASVVPVLPVFDVTVVLVILECLKRRVAAVEIDRERIKNSHNVGNDDRPGGKILHKFGAVTRIPPSENLLETTWEPPFRR